MAVTGVPMLPPTWTAMPDSRRMCPMSAVVVVLPLVPVMPMVRPLRNGAASSTSPMTRTPRRRASSSGGQIGGHSGGEDDQGGVVGAGCWVRGSGSIRLLGEWHVQALQFARGFGQFARGVSGRLRVTSRLGQEQPDGGQAGFFEAHYQHAGAGERCWVLGAGCVGLAGHSHGCAPSLERGAQCADLLCRACSVLPSVQSSGFRRDIFQTSGNF